MSAAIAVLHRTAICDAVLDEIRDNNDLAADVLSYVLGQIAMGIDGAQAVAEALFWLQRRCEFPTRN